MNITRVSLAACFLVTLTSWAAVELVSVRDPAVPLPATGAGESAIPIYSGDGRFLVFTSAAPNLTTNRHSGIHLDVYVRELSSGKVTLVSATQDGQAGGNGESVGFGVSRDGRFVVFQSSASNLVAGDDNDGTDIFVRDVTSGITTLVSANAQGRPTNGESLYPEITRDGRYVFFESAASDLVANDTNGRSDVFRRELAPGTTVLISAGVDGESAKGGDSNLGAASDDGQIVAFRSQATNVVTTVTTDKPTDLYLHNFSSGATTRITVDKPSGNFQPSPPFPPGRFSTFNPILSGDGRYLTFETGRLRLTTGDFGGVYWFDLLAGTNALAFGNVYSGNDDDLSGPTMSADGRTIAFEGSYGEAPVNFTTIYVWNADTGLSDLRNPFIDANVPPPAAFQPVLSPDGKSLALISDAFSDDGVAQLYHHPLEIRFPADFFFELVNAQPDGKPGGGMDFSSTEYSPDGTGLAFDAQSDTLVADDRNREMDVFIRNLDTKTTTLASTRDPSLPGLSGNGQSTVAGISGDGRFVVFTSFANDLVPDDNNNSLDVFVRDLVAGKTILVSANTNGVPANATSRAPVISADGRLVAFSSFATDLVGIDTKGHENVFLRDLGAGTTRVLSVTPDGSATGSGESTAPVISADGTVVAFQGTAINLVAQTPAGQHVFVVDVLAGSIARANAGLPPASVTSISSDGSMIAFAAPAAYVFQRLTGQAQRISSPGGASALLSGDGDFALLYQSLRGLVRRQLRGGTEELLLPSSRNSRPTAISADGRYMLADVFYTAPPTSPKSQVVIFDGEHTNDPVTASASVLTGLPSPGDSDNGAMSADGRLVVFTSDSPELWPGLVGGMKHVFARDLVTGAVTLLSLAAGTATGADGPSSRPLVSADGRRAVFTSFGSDLAAGDFNGFGDVFAVALPAHGDSDGDGLDDLWEQFLFGNLDQTGAMDFDGDGADNASELGAGTSPLFPESQLRLSLTPKEDSGLTLSWPTVLNRRYFLESRAGLSGDWQSEPEGIIGNGETVTVPAVVGDQPQMYLRVSVR